MLCRRAHLRPAVTDGGPKGEETHAVDSDDMAGRPGDEVGIQLTGTSIMFGTDELRAGVGVARFAD